MGVKRTIICVVCGISETLDELYIADGFPKWGALQGICLDGENHPTLCPKHLAKVADYLDTLKGETDGVD